MKILKKILIGIGIVLVVLILIVSFFLGHVVKAGIEKVGPQFAGVDMTLTSARVYPLLGHVSLKGLVIGNPEGFKTPSAMQLGKFKIKLDTSSVFTDTIVIKEIHIDAPEITYEQALKANNLSTIQKNLAGDKPKEKKPKEEVAEEPASDKPAKKVVIEDFLFENGKVNVSVTLAGGKQLTLPLPTIHLEDIGKDSGGASINDVIKELMGAITKAAGQAVASSGDIAGNAKDAAKKMGGAANDAAQGATDAAKGAADSVKKGVGKLFGK